MSEQQEDSLYFRFRERYQFSLHMERSKNPIVFFDGSALTVIDQGRLKLPDQPDFSGLFISILENAKWNSGPIIPISSSHAATHVVLSPNRNFLALNYDERKIFICDVHSKTRLINPKATFESSKDITCLAWSPDCRWLASGSRDNTVSIWDVDMKRRPVHLTTPGGTSYIAWSSDGSMLAHAARTYVSSGDKCPVCGGDTRLGDNYCLSCGQRLLPLLNQHHIAIYDAKTGKDSIKKTLGNSDAITCLAWSPDSQMLATGLSSYAIHIQYLNNNAEILLEGMPSEAVQISFSADNVLLVAMCEDASICLWNLVTDEHGVLTIPSAEAENAWTQLATKHVSPLALSVQVHAIVLVTYDATNNEICIWEFDINRLKTEPLRSSEQYTNAKVVLVGDSGVGKSGLGLVLTRQAFAPTESTHGRHIWTLDDQQITLTNGRKERREVLLWDLAGQPGYRLIHQLHLSDVAVALVVFDVHSETDPFAGVSHWARALRIARQAEQDTLQIMKTLLVAARIDRGSVGVSRQRINMVLQQFGFDGYFETSAKSGRNIGQLLTAIMENIAWESLPKVTSSSLFQTIRGFLIAEKEAGRLLVTSDELFRTFIHAHPDLSGRKNLRPQFDVCVRRMESKGLLRRLSFGDLLLLQPEMLDAYASALINAIKDESDGLGNISEEQVQKAHFEISPDERIADREQEKLLLIAMIEDLLRYEVALREHGDDGAYLIFPTQSTRENPDLPDPEGKSIIFEFEGPVQNIYATLAVRLSHSGLFRKQELWKNAITYTAQSGGTYGLYLCNIGEGRGELTLFFDKITLEPICFHFEEYVQAHLQRRALPGTIQRRRIFVCPKCAIPLHDLHVVRRRERGLRWMTCGVCDAKVDISDGMERLARIPHSQISNMDRSADIERSRSTTVSILQGKLETKDFDVFLCHNGEDKPFVKEIGEKLKERGLLPWLDEWNLQPGLPWQRTLERQIDKIQSAAVFVGKDGIGPWQQMELEAFLRKFVNTGRPVIPVLLPVVAQVPQLPLFLEGMTWVDFRIQDPNPIARLIWGITGKPQDP
jgi:small GTP-binding protein